MSLNPIVKRRAFGQHFLRDKNLCMRIAEATLTECKNTGAVALLEIGPGKGAITDPLMQQLALLPKDQRPSFLLSERDIEIGQDWLQKGIPVEIEDFLKLPEDRWLKATPLVVASNLPYSAGTAIVNRLAEHPDKIPAMVLMFQAEVAQRLRAEKNSKPWGSLSVWIQNNWDVSLFADVPPKAFAPPPKVDSEVVILRARKQPRVAIQNKVLWQKLLLLCFAHRRKMLRSGIPAGPWRDLLQLANIDGTLRAEALDWQQWAALQAAAEKTIDLEKCKS